MKANGYGRIVNVSSFGGVRWNTAYSVSKAALNVFTRKFAAELANTGILVNSVDPGWVATDMGSYRYGWSWRSASAERSKRNSLGCNIIGWCSYWRIFLWWWSCTMVIYIKIYHISTIADQRKTNSCRVIPCIDAENNTSDLMLFYVSFLWIKLQSNPIPLIWSRWRFTQFIWYDKYHQIITLILSPWWLIAFMASHFPMCVPLWFAEIYVKGYT